jgi:lipopolysaccharide export system protein LptA
LKVLNVAATGGATTSELTGDLLTARFVRVGGADHISEVHGEGHTSLRKVSATGVVNTGAGDSMVAHFRPVTGGSGRRGDKGQKGRQDALGVQGADEVADATELGHVVMTELPARKAGDTTAPVEERVSAERAVYDGELERTTLTGNVQVSDGTSVLWADRVVTEQQSGDATADGSVKASYGQPGSADEPVHVLAARAELKHDSQTATFHGVAGKPARLWQGASQVDAPVLQFEQRQKRLLARGEGQGAPMAVRTVLVGGRPSAPSTRLEATSATRQDATRPDATRPGPASRKLLAGDGKTDVILVSSRELVYSNEARKAEFTGGIQVESKDGTMRGQQVVVYLQPEQSDGAGKTLPNAGKGAGAKSGVTSPAGGGGFMGGSVERMVVSGHIDMDQPGRRATGEQLVYTASDATFVLTGTPTVLPKVTDDQRGTVTGTSLRFHSGDDNVVVSNGGETGTGQRVRTETRVKNKQ